MTSPISRYPAAQGCTERLREKSNIILKVDAAQLEWRVKVLLAQCPVGMKEIEEMEAGRFDIHTDNQTKLLNLGSHPKGRVFAKNFIYQMIFQDVFGEQGIAAAGHGFASKADFLHVFPGSLGERATAWRKVAENFFEKYPSIHQHSIQLIREATTTGRVAVPSGRFYPFQPEPTFRGLDWPRTKILNYPVQGFSADLVQIARSIIWEHLIDMQNRHLALLINTVHDDIEMDVDNDPELVYNICILLENAFRRIPEQFKKKYGTTLNVPMAGEVKFGVNLNEASMMKFKKQTFEQDYKDYVEKICSSKSK